MSATIGNAGVTTSTAPGAGSKIAIADTSASGQKRNVAEEGVTHMAAQLPQVSVGAATLALAEGHRGRGILLDNASSAISINTDNLTSGFSCLVFNSTGSDYTFPTPTGTGASTVGPTNGDTKIKNNGMASVICIGNAVWWRGDTAA